MKMGSWKHFRIAHALAAAVLISGGLACDDGLPVPPEEFEPVGTWTATAFTAAFPGQTYDVLAEGGSIDVVLHPNGTISGTYVWPGLDGTESYDLELEGTWTREGQNRVYFTHQEGPYLRYVLFAGGGNQMAGEGSADGVIVNIVLRRG